MCRLSKVRRRQRCGRSYNFLESGNQLINFYSGNDWLSITYYRNYYRKCPALVFALRTQSIRCVCGFKLFPNHLEACKIVTITVGESPRLCFWMTSSICRPWQKSKNKIKNKRRKTASNRAELTGSHVSKSWVICINGTSGERRRKKNINLDWKILQLRIKLTTVDICFVEAGPSSRLLEG